MELLPLSAVLKRHIRNVYWVEANLPVRPQTATFCPGSIDMDMPLRTVPPDLEMKSVSNPFRCNETDLQIRRCNITELDSTATWPLPLRLTELI